MGKIFSIWLKITPIRSKWQVQLIHQIMVVGVISLLSEHIPLGISELANHNHVIKVSKISGHPR